MSATRTTGFSLKRATIVSFVLHFLAAAAIVVTPQSAARSTGAGDGNASEAVRVSTITIAFRPHAAVAAQHPSAPARTLRAESARTSVTVVAVTKPTRFSRAATSPAHAVAARPLALRESTRIVADTLVAPNAASNRLDETTLSKTTGESAAGGGATIAPERPLAMPVVAPVPSPSNAARTNGRARRVTRARRRSERRLGAKREAARRRRRRTRKVTRERTRVGNDHDCGRRQRPRHARDVTRVACERRARRAGEKVTLHALSAGGMQRLALRRHVTAHAVASTAARRSTARWTSPSTACLYCDRRRASNPARGARG